MSLNTYPGNPFPPSTEQMHEGDNEDLQAQINAIKDGTDIDSFGDVESALAAKTDLEVIAPEFDAEAGTYDIGDLVTYQGKLYEFTSAHSTAGDWDSTEVTEKSVSDEIDTLKSGLTNTQNYSTTAVIIGKWIDAKDLYRKVIYLGNLPDTTQVKVDTGISTISRVVRLYGIAQSQWVAIPLPYVDSNASSNASLAFDFNGNKVSVTTIDNKSSLIGYAVIEYTID